MHLRASLLILGAKFMTIDRIGGNKLTFRKHAL
jgi:hypothetical protein